MNKIKKILITLVITILAILGFNIVSNAISVGEIHYMDYNKYLANKNDWFCFQHKEKLRRDEHKAYKVIAGIKIEGTESTDHKGKVINHYDNAKMVYILSQNNGANKETGPVTNEIWNLGYDWLTSVGQNHSDLYLGFGKKKGGVITSLKADSISYADRISKDQKIVDNTKKDKIKVTSFEEGKEQYMRIGPFNWTFPGELTKLNLYDQDSKNVKNLRFSSFSGKKETFYNMNEIKSGKNFYIIVSVDSGLEKVTKIAATASQEVLGVKVWFLDCQAAGYQNVIRKETPYTTKKNIDGEFKYNIPALGDLKIIKVDKDDNKIKLKDVGFYVQNDSTKKYVKRSSSGKITYVDKREQATEFVTNKDGEISIKNLTVGKYMAYETKNPNYGYVVKTGGQQTTIKAGKGNKFVIENEKIYIKLSGYVWVDMQSEKQSLRNDLFKDNDFDDKDTLLDGITVRLKSKSTGKTIKETKTANGGKYQFEDVLIKDLGDYYIEFEYDGLTYSNVTPNINKDNGSKAAENAGVRDQFNKKFSSVEPGNSADTGFTRDENGKEAHELKYELDEPNRKSKLINNGQYTILANTEETKYSIKSSYEKDKKQTEVKFINLGLYIREQPRTGINKDIENVKLTVNGYEHVYNYAQRINENNENFENTFNVGVKFGRNSGENTTYRRAVYQADYEYVNEAEKSKELKAYITYNIKLTNASTHLQTRVNSVVDYFDSKYGIKAVGTGVNNGEVTGSLDYNVSDYGNGYSKAIIDTNIKLDPQKAQSIYVQFELSREQVVELVNGRDIMKNNIAEINSYSVFDSNGKVYAGIDEYSNPGNAIPGNRNTYQADTDVAPGLTLEVADAREMTGTVFVDSVTGEVKAGQVRQGNGEFDDGEIVIEGVDVTLTETTGSGEEPHRTKTDSDGNFKFEGYIPGDYTLTYTWGNETYTVQNYKGTIYDNTRDQNNKFWYKENVDKRLTDAMDRYDERQKIDDEIKLLTHSTQSTIHKMNSDTPNMGVGIEYETAYTASEGDKYTFEIKNIDFGIVERAKQELSMEKRVNTMKVTLANGQVVVDVTIDENGNISGNRNHFTHMKPSDPSMGNGFAKVELDNELIQGAKVEVTYEIRATNNSEADYLSENFYKYGTHRENIITIKPSAIIDYLDKDWAFDSEKNKDWEVKSKDEIKDLVAEVVYNSQESTINDKTILYTEKLKDKNLEPTQSESVMLSVSKVMSNGEEIELQNEMEVAKLEKTGGSLTVSTPGNYIPGKGYAESDDSIAETIIVTPSTGENRDYVMPIVIGATALIVLAAGVVIIKKKAL